MKKMITEHYHSTRHLPPCQDSSKKFDILNRKDDEILTASTTIRAAQAKGYTAREFWKMLCNSGYPVGFPTFYQYLADDAKPSKKQMIIKEAAVNLLKSLESNEEVPFSLKLKAAGITMRVLHSRYCIKYDSSISYETFRRSVMTPYTTNEYNIAVRAEKLLDELAERKK